MHGDCAVSLGCCLLFLNLLLVSICHHNGVSACYADCIYLPHSPSWIVKWKLLLDLFIFYSYISSWTVHFWNNKLPYNIHIYIKWYDTFFDTFYDTLRNYYAPTMEGPDRSIHFLDEIVVISHINMFSYSSDWSPSTAILGNLRILQEETKHLLLVKV